MDAWIFQQTIVSAHRTPERMYDYAKSAKDRGFEVIIAGAGGAAHLPGKYKNTQWINRDMLFQRKFQVTLCVCVIVHFYFIDIEVIYLLEAFYFLGLGFNTLLHFCDGAISSHCFLSHHHHHQV